ETVEKVSSAIPEAMLEDAEAAIGAEIHPDEEPRRRGRRGRRGQRGAGSPYTAPAPMPAAAGAMGPASDPWGSLLQAGRGFLQPLAGATQRPNHQGAQPATGNGGPSLLRRDESTGETYLRLPVPPPEVIEQAAQALGSLLQSLRG